MDAGLLGLVRELDEQGKAIAFICHGGWVAASAGIVAGRRVTGNPAIEDDMRNAGARVGGRRGGRRRPPGLLAQPG
jgi:protease I